MKQAACHSITTSMALPTGSAIATAPHQHLPRLLHTMANGIPRSHRSAGLLADELAVGRIVVEDVVLPWRPSLDEGMIDAILADEASCIETAAHRVLKVHARILALAVDPAAHLMPEAAATRGPHPLRADLLAWHAFGVSETYECGATDGRGIFRQLIDGQIRVTVLPFAGLSLPYIRGYAFRLAANPPVRSLHADAGQAAWARLMASHADPMAVATPMAA